MTSETHVLELPHVPAATMDRRAGLFRETPTERLERWALGTAWALRPPRLASLPALTRLWIEDKLSGKDGLPDPERVVDPITGACGIVRDLEAATLMAAYRKGLFTFAHFGPLKWLSLPERCVLFFNELHIPKRLRRQLRQGEYKVTFDRDFEGVIKACAGRRSGKWHVTWITPRIMHAYAALYDAGHVHSFEVWNQEGALVGGGYGVAVGNVFCTESQFSLEPNTSKIGFTVLNWHLAKWGFALNDGKWPTPTITDMGFRCITRAEFRGQLAMPGQAGPVGRWHVEDDLDVISKWQPENGVMRAEETQNAAQRKKAPATQRAAAADDRGI
jgi:leucyl/phenylalanyl-tRNA---protein transferase